jgi:putative transposase
MSDYRRVFVPGGTYFFTLVTWNRRPLLATEERVGLLRESFRRVREQRPFVLEAAVILPDHLHCILRLPAGDADYPGRWREIKKRFSAQVARDTNARHERLVWQRRYYEHAIRDEEDWRRHLDYLHYNPVKHGLVGRVRDWPWSSFGRGVERGWYDVDWGRQAPEDLRSLEPGEWVE